MVTWDSTADQNLLLFVIATNPGIKIEYEAIAQMLQAKGVNCTVDAVKNRLKRLKKMVQESEGGGDATATPKKTVSTPKSAKSSKRTTKNAQGNEDDDPETPSKKPKTEREAGKATSAVKTEREAENKLLAFPDDGEFFNCIKEEA